MTENSKLSKVFRFRKNYHCDFHLSRQEDQYVRIMILNLVNDTLSFYWRKLIFSCAENCLSLPLGGVVKGVIHHGDTLHPVQEYPRPRHLEQSLDASLKGQCPEIFYFWFFFMNQFPPAPEYSIKNI
jgi:hypothetical protein